MLRMPKFSWLEAYQERGVIFIRLIIGFDLVYGTQDNVFSYGRMLEFANFLAVRGVPFPLFSAFLSAYAQFICGILLIVGGATRHSALIMVINVATLLIAHLGDSYAGMFPALMMLAAACFLFMHGPGKLSVDNVFSREGKPKQQALGPPLNRV